MRGAHGLLWKVYGIAASNVKKGSRSRTKFSDTVEIFNVFLVLSTLKSGFKNNKKIVGNLRNHEKTRDLASAKTAGF